MFAVALGDVMSQN